MGTAPSIKKTNKIVGLQVRAKSLAKRAKSTGTNCFISVDSTQEGVMETYASCSRQFVIDLMYHVFRNDPDLVMQAMTRIKADITQLDAETKEAAQEQAMAKAAEAAEHQERTEADGVQAQAEEGYGAEGAVHPAMGAVRGEEPTVEPAPAGAGAPQVPPSGVTPDPQGDLPGVHAEAGQHSDDHPGGAQAVGEDREQA